MNECPLPGPPPNSGEGDGSGSQKVDVAAKPLNFLVLWLTADGWQLITGEQHATQILQPLSTDLALVA
ncbi:MAG: hypothetical protein HN413_03925 [Chloroflexi bacterium]|jgi:hypothetical protein|nr:hypothetical protein [Chloroflexota bacterium]